MMRRLSIRWKMTLWYGGVLTIVLVAFGSVIFFVMRHQLLEGIDRELTEELEDVLSEFSIATTSDALRAWLERRFASHEGFDFQVTDSNGERFFHSARLADLWWPLPIGSSNEPRIETIRLEVSGDWRIIDCSVAGPPGLMRIQVGRSLRQFNRELAELLTTLALAGPITLAVAIGGGYFLAGRVLRPVHEITQTAQRISADRLDKRVLVANPDDELGQLAGTLNEMIERLEGSFREMQRFTADAAHELRTPLAVIRNEAEVALRQPRTTEEYRSVLETLLEEANRLSEIANQLLFLCRHDAGTTSVMLSEVDLQHLLEDVVGNLQIVAASKGVALALKENPACRVISDGRLLQRILINLLDNAIKYTNSGGTVAVASDVGATHVSLLICDTGIGISPDKLPHVFDRFYRVNGASNGESDGVGLGLSICNAIAHSLSARLSLKSNFGEGTTAELLLPHTRQ